MIFQYGVLFLLISNSAWHAQLTSFVIPFGKKSKDTNLFRLPVWDLTIQWLISPQTLITRNNRIMSLLVETLFDIDNLPSIKAYPKSPTGFTYTCITGRVVWMYSTRFWPLRPEFEPRDRLPLSTTPSYKHPCQRGILKLSCTTGLSIVVK